MGYHAIEDYGIIGDMHTAALVSKTGSIDWLCFPHFDSPSIFAALLDDKKGGSFKIEPMDGDVTFKQMYWPNTNILITRFLSDDGVAEFVDYMPVSPSSDLHKHRHQLVRNITVVRGSFRFRMQCKPAFDYGRADHDIQVNDHSVVFSSSDLDLALLTTHKLSAASNAAYCEFSLQEGESATFILCKAEHGQDEHNIQNMHQKLFTMALDFWHNWLDKCTYTGRWREMVQRSALLLKLLTFEPTGAIVAAPTCSLPEHIGGERNWDYRYTWLRDAAFTLYGLIRIGFTEEAEKFMGWLEERCHEMNPDGSLQIMYGIDGRHDLKEEELSHLEGYRGSRPVRIGNGAYQQLQLDIYGELMDTVYLSNKYSAPISYDLWKYLTRLLEYVSENWQRPDEGIWEVRSGKQRFTYSMLMSWVALDRGERLAQKRSFPGDVIKWRNIRNKIYEEIMTNGWNDELQTFVQAVGSRTLDASTLIMPLVFFLSPSDPRMLKTLEAIDKAPHKGGLVSDSLVYRYNLNETTDGLLGEEGTFNMCSFWLVEALTRAGRFDRDRLYEASLMFEKMFGYANHLGLYAEEIGPRGEALGNFPQAFTHLSLISAAYNLNRALG